MRRAARPMRLAFDSINALFARQRRIIVFPPARRTCVALLDGLPIVKVDGIVLPVYFRTESSGRIWSLKIWVMIIRLVQRV